MLSVAVGFLNDLWSSTRRALAREKVSAALLAGLAAHRPEQAGELADTLKRRVQLSHGRLHERRHRQVEFRRFMDRWKKRHLAKRGSAGTKAAANTSP